MARFTLRDDRTMFLFVFRAEHDSAGTFTKSQLRNEVRRHGVGMFPQILTALDDVDDLYFDVVSQIRMDRWSRGRVAADRRRRRLHLAARRRGHRPWRSPRPTCWPENSIAPATTIAAPSTATRRSASFHQDKQAGAERMIGFFAPRTRFGLVGSRRRDSHDELPTARRAVRRQHARRLRTARLRNLAFLKDT